MKERSQMENEKSKTAALSPARARRPYSPPVLRRLGSVQELTLGGGASPVPDTKRTSRAPGM
jgi:hypothetical protein